MGLPNDHMFFGLAETMTEEQRDYVNAMLSNKKRLIFVNAKSGTGKTTLAVMAAAVREMELLYVFSPVEEGAMGFRPGTQEEKEAAYLQPLYDALYEMGEEPMRAVVSDSRPENTKKGTAWVQAISHIFMRGSNRSNKFIIIDEAQNYTLRELKKVLTRIHDDCIVVVIGHDKQCDLKNKNKSGFTRYIKHFENEPYVAVCNLTKNFRGELAQKADELEEDE